MPSEGEMSLLADLDLQKTGKSIKDKTSRKVDFKIGSQFTFKNKDIQQ